MKQLLASLTLLLISFFSAHTQAEQLNLNSGEFDLIELGVAEKHKFHGLASYLNAIHFFAINEQGKLEQISINKTEQTLQAEVLVIAGRYKALVLENSTLELNPANQNSFTLKNSSNSYLLDKQKIASTPPLYLVIMRIA